MMTLTELQGWKALPSATYQADAEGKVTVTLPEDFLSLLSLRLSSWERPVREVLPPSNWLYRLQAMRWTGLRGCPSRPLAFFTTDNEGRPALELYSCEPNALVSLEEFRYLSSAADC